MSTYGLVLAAGSGQRFGSNKMLVKIGGRFPWEIVRAAMRPSVETVTVVGVDIAGGESRRESVLKGLESLPENARRVIISDGARFLVSPSHFREISRAKGSAIAFGSLLVNSVFNLHTNEPLVRHNAWNIHTPQCFDILFLSHLLARHAESWIHDEWSLARYHYPKQCSLIDGDWRTGHKLTIPSDLELMGALHAIGKP